CDDAPVPGRETGSPPEIAFDNLTGVLLQRGRDGTEIFGFRHRTCSFDICLLRGGRTAGDQAERNQGCCDGSHRGLPSTLAGCAISNHETNAAQSTVTALTRKRTFSLAPAAINPSAGLASPWARSRKAV